MKTPNAAETAGRTGMGRLLGATALLSLTLAVSPALAQGQGTDVPAHVTGEVTAQPEEETGVLEAPPPNPRRVYVADQDNFNVVNRIYVIDGEEGKLLGMLDAGMLANVNLAPDGGDIYVSQTLYSRVSRGERNDFIEIWDPVTLAPKGEINIPEERFLIMTMDSMAQISPDGRYLLYYRFSPAPGAGIVDLQEQRHLTTVDVPDCYFVLPTAPTRFYMHCRQGSLLRVSFNEAGEAQTQESQPFHPEDKHLFDQPAFSAADGKAFFISYEGTVYPADLSGDEPQIAQSWEMFPPEERQQNWRPSGWQISAYHRQTQQLYVLGNQGAEFTHHNPASDVFVYNANTGERLNRFTLDHPANSISVSQDGEPLLFALDSENATLQIYNAANGELRGKVDQLGHAPHFLVTAPGS